MLLQSSVAFQVRVMTPVLPQPGAKASVWLIVTAPHVSLPVACPVPAGLVSSVHSTVLSEGTVRLGLVVSTTVIFWAALVALLQASVAVQVRVITPVLPQPGAKASVWLIVTAPHVSLPMASPVPLGLVSSAHSTVLSEGTVRLGLVVSTTVIF